MLSHSATLSFHLVTGELSLITFSTFFHLLLRPLAPLTSTSRRIMRRAQFVTMAAETLAGPDPDVMIATIVDSNDSNVGGGGGAAMRGTSSTSSTYSHVSDASSSGLATESRPTLSRASSIGYSDDGSMTSSFRTHHSCASASMEGIDLLGAPSSSTGALPLSGKRPFLPLIRLC